MRVVKYYDYINKRYIDVEVSDEVAKFLEADRKRMRRKQIADNYYISFSLDEVVKYGDGDSLLFHEIIEDVNANIDKQIKSREWEKTVWSVVDKLEDKKKKIIYGFYFYGYNSTTLANYFDMSKSAFSQFKNTCINDLLYLFSNDNNFVKSNYYLFNTYTPFADEIIKTTEDNIKSGFDINLNNVFDLIKDTTQVKKKMSGLGIDVDDNALKLLDKMTKIVKPVIKQLIGEEKNKEKKLTIPSFEDILKLIK